ncbi:ATP-binding protein [Pedobacter sp.]
MTETEENILPPSAARLAESLRDTGYTFTTSVADIVDNSVAADATNINISLDLELGQHPVLMIADNGRGMSEDELQKAMAYGSPKRPDPKSLGKFGMGLKTASTSFCRRLTVISRKDGAINLRQWDLDVIVAKDKWLLLQPDEKDYSEAIEFMDQVAGGESGTVVIWENIDRLVRTHASGTMRTQINSIREDLKDHLSGVFYNFLEKENDFPDITININDASIEPWDPFCRWMNSDGSSRVEIHKQEPVDYTSTKAGVSEVMGTFHINVYILPNKNTLSSEEVNKSRYSLDNQGFHIFREGRMIFSGGWPNRLFVKDPHLNLIRVELSFDHKLDDIFQIDIKKSRIDFPKNIQELLKKIITPPRREAQKRYRSGTQDSNTSGYTKLGQQHEKASNAIGKHHEETTAQSQIGSTDREAGTAQITNQFGVSNVRLQFNDSPNRVVQTSSSLQDGVLWTPGLIEGNKHAVFLNESHEFYKRFYLANQDNSTLILAMDSLLWSLAEAELCVYSDTVKRNLEEMRISVSRSLRTLAEELPDIDDSENDIDDEQNNG